MLHYGQIALSLKRAAVQPVRIPRVVNLCSGKTFKEVADKLKLVFEVKSIESGITVISHGSLPVSEETGCNIKAV